MFNEVVTHMRPYASRGLWLRYLLPACLFMSYAKHQALCSYNYKQSIVISVGFVILDTISQLFEKISMMVSVYLFITAIFVASLSAIWLHLSLPWSIMIGICLVSSYYPLTIITLKRLSKTFTLGEISICIQAFMLVLFSSILNIVHNFSSSSKSNMQCSTLVIQIGFLSLVGLIVFVNIFQISKPTYIYTAIIGTASILVFSLFILLEQSPVNWFFLFINGSHYTWYLLLFWMICSTIAIKMIMRQTTTITKVSTAIRKYYHILMVVILLPGVLYSCTFVYFSTGFILCILVFMEFVRLVQLPPIGEFLQQTVHVFRDEKEVGCAVLTQIYLLAGCSLPLWLHPAPCDITDATFFTILPLLSGILSVGIGDTVASLIGSKLGRHYWSKHSKKTIEGTIACILGQFLFIFILCRLEFIVLIPFDMMKTVVAILVSSIVEAKTNQNDNLVLPFVMYLFLI